LIRKIEEFNGPKKWLTEWENRERQKSEIERKNEKKLFDAIDGEKWERAKELIENGTKFDHVYSGGTGTICWLLCQAYYNNHDKAERIWKEIKEETKKEEIEKNWTSLMVMENYGDAALVISWTNSTITVAESKMPILNTLLVKDEKDWDEKIILDDEKISQIINGIGEKVGANINAELNAIGAKNLFENNYDFFEKFILAKSNPVYWLILLSRGNGWKPEFTKKILEKLEEKIMPKSMPKSKHQNLKSIFTQNANVSLWIEWLAKLKNPILNLLSLANEIGWTDELAKEVLDKIENKIEIIQNDLNLIAEIDQIGQFSNALTNFIIFGEKTKLFDGPKILADLDRPLNFLFLLSKEKEWTENFTTRILKNMDENKSQTIQRIQNNFKVIEENDQIKEYSNRLANFIIFCQKENIFGSENLLAKLNNPIHFLHLLSEENIWTEDLTKTILENFGENKNKIIQKNLRYVEQNGEIQKYADVLANFITIGEKRHILDCQNLFGKVENPIYFLLLLSKTSCWTDTLTELFFDNFGENFRTILEDDIKFMTEKGYLKNVENELPNLVSFAKRLNLFKNKYFDSEPLTWQYAHGSNKRFLAAFLKELNISGDLIAEIENGNLKVILTYDFLSLTEILYKIATRG